MSALLLIVLSAVLISHFALTSVPALKPFVRADGFDAALGLAIAVSICTAIAAPLCFLLRHLVLLPFDVAHLEYLLFIVSIMLIAQLVRLVFEQQGRWVPVGPALFALLTGNSAILGAALLVPTRESIWQAISLGIGVGASFAVLLLCFTTLQARLRHAPIAASFRGAPLALITAGVIALALMGFTGLIAE
ncbi:MAG TPA: Rnf-Nqr domain containing protein [Steroidobacteraceae bacterium]